MGSINEREKIATKSRDTATSQGWVSTRFLPPIFFLFYLFQIYPRSWQITVPTPGCHKKTSTVSAQICECPPPQLQVTPHFSKTDILDNGSRWYTTRASFNILWLSCIYLVASPVEGRHHNAGDEAVVTRVLAHCAANHPYFVYLPWVIYGVNVQIKVNQIQCRGPLSVYLMLFRGTACTVSIPSLWLCYMVGYVA